MAAPTDHLVLRGTLTGHGGWVTALATSMEVPDMLLSASRGMYSQSGSDDGDHVM
jgi:hypothetical protein